MTPSRLEAFSDGVIAIIMTVMVLGLVVPHGTTFSALHPLISTFVVYTLSFIFLGIYWVNHHHLLRATERINGAILWANLHLLFWLTLFPFFTGWVGSSKIARDPTIAYGIVLLMAAFAYWILQASVIRSQGEGSLVKHAVGRDLKGKSSPVLNLTGILLTFAWPIIGLAVHSLVAAIWFVPDRRLERHLEGLSEEEIHKH